MKATSRCESTLPLQTSGEVRRYPAVDRSASFLARTGSILKRVARSLLDLFPESYPWMPEQEARKVIPDLENFSVFNGRWVRVRRKHHGNE